MPFSSSNLLCPLIWICHLMSMEGVYMWHHCDWWYTYSSAWKWWLLVMFRITDSRDPDRWIGIRVYLQLAVWGVLGCLWWCVGWFRGLEPLSAVCLRHTFLHIAEDQTYPDATDIICHISHFIHSHLQNNSFDTTVNLVLCAPPLITCIRCSLLIMLIKEVTNIILVFHRKFTSTYYNI